MRDGTRGRLKSLRALLRGRAAERELAEELAHHIELETEQNIRRGMTPERARRQALLAFNGVDRFAEEVRLARWTSVLEDLLADVRYALRSLLRRPGFAAAAIGTLALGIGGTTAVFSVTDALFLRAPSGVRDASDVVRIFVARDEGSVRTPMGGPGSWVDYEALRRGAAGFAAVAPHLPGRFMEMGRGGAAERVRGDAVGHGYFPLLGVRAAHGRLFSTEEDDTQGTHPVVVLSHGMWQRLGGDPELLGTTIALNDQPLTVIGVVEPAFTGLDLDPVDVWVPTAMAAPLGLVGMMGDADWRQVPGMAMVHFLGRLVPGADRASVTESATAVLRHAAEAAPELDPTPDVLLGSLIPGRALHRGASSSLALWLLLVAGVVLAIACANVLGLLLARMTARGREFAVRLSLGAGRGRLMRQHVTETLVLTILGGCAGVLLAYWGAGVARQFPLPPGAGGVDGRILLFALAISLVIGLLLGVVPALRAARVETITGLKDTRGTLTPSRGRLRRTLVLMQVTLSVVLLVGAGLFVRSLRAVHAIDAGFDVERLVLVSVDAARAGYQGAEREEFLADARRRIESLAGVERTAMAHFGPFASAAMSMHMTAPHGGADAAVLAEADVEWAGPGYFETVGTRILEGRGFADYDRDGPGPVAVINEALARLIASGGDVVGLCVPLGNQAERGVCTQIIGVAQNHRRRFLDEAENPVIFLARDRSPNALSWGGPVLIVRTRVQDAATTAQLRAAVQGVRPDLPYVHVQALEERIRTEVLPYRLGATLFTLFGALALALAAVGLYGVLSYYVTERAAEIGIRRSLGATDAAVIGLLARQGMAPVAAGLVLGLAIAAAGTTLLASLIFGISAHDPAAFAGAALFLVLVALAATVLPARRATAVDPMVALRAE
jgi:putative ABC transport system permease protein